MKSHLSRHQPRTIWDDDDIQARAKEAWHRHGILLIRPDDLSGWERQFADGIGDKLYGRRHGS